MVFKSLQRLQPSDSLPFVPDTPRSVTGHSYPPSVCELNLMFLEALIANNLPLLAAWLASVQPSQLSSHVASALGLLSCLQCWRLDLRPQG